MPATNEANDIMAADKSRVALKPEWIMYATGEAVSDRPHPEIPDSVIEEAFAIRARESGSRAAHWLDTASTVGYCVGGTSLFMIAGWTAIAALHGIMAALKGRFGSAEMEWMGAPYGMLFASFTVGVTWREFVVRLLACLALGSDQDRWRAWNLANPPMFETVPNVLESILEYRASAAREIRTVVALEPTGIRILEPTDCPNDAAKETAFPAERTLCGITTNADGTFDLRLHETLTHASWTGRRLRGESAGMDAKVRQVFRTGIPADATGHVNHADAEAHRRSTGFGEAVPI